MSDLLRTYFIEFFHRIITFGAGSLPASFNVAEAFFALETSYGTLDLRPEREHLLRLADFFEWYTAGQIPDLPGALVEIVEEGVIYSYDLVDPAEGFPLEIGDGHEVVLVGVSMIRHGSELSLLALAGERPASVAGASASPQGMDVIADYHKGVTPAAGLTAEDRYLEGLPQHGRVVSLARIDLVARAFEARYVNVDMGPSFSINTDDPACFPGDTDMSTIEASVSGLKRYSALIAALTSLIYLPAFFLSEHKRVERVSVPTPLYTQRKDKRNRAVLRDPGPYETPKSREIACLSLAQSAAAPATCEVAPPGFKVKTTGYWKRLPAGQFGQDPKGNRVIGRTWVERIDTWTEESCGTFLLRQRPAPTGPDPGTVYVMRSPSNATHVYKIGLTRRTAEQRAAELSSATGVSLPFGVLAEWQVRDCEAAEAAVHERLAYCRFNARREFFRAPLTTIIAAVNETVRSLDPPEGSG